MRTTSALLIMMMTAVISLHCRSAYVKVDNLLSRSW